MGSVAPSFDPSTIKIEDRLYINGEFVPSKSGKKFDVVNPATEKLAASVYEGSVEDVDAAVAAAKAAFPAWSELGVAERAGYIEKICQKMEAHVEEFSYLDAISMGKPTTNDMMTGMSIAMFRYYAGRSWETLGDSSLNSANMVNMSFRQPYGVCGAIVSLWPFLFQFPSFLHLKTPATDAKSILFRSHGTRPSPCSLTKSGLPFSPVTPWSSNPPKKPPSHPSSSPASLPK